MTWSEFREHFNIGLALPNLRKGTGGMAGAKAGNPDAIDWVEKGAVTDVKDQGSCGSCWAFSTTGALEGAYQQKTGSLKEFSEQQLVDCDQVDAGCNGGLMDQAFDWVKGNGGLCSEADYPYTSGGGHAGTCSTSCSVDSASAVTKYTDVKPKDVGALETAVAQQPVAVAIAVNSNFQMYTSGVFDGRCGFQLNHGVLTVGYGTDAGQDFWKVKNSWGADWGEGGYIRLVKDSSDECKIMDAASYPTL
jgi:C1A family cysteine protease